MNFSFKQWVESTAVDFAQYDLQKKYDHYNALLFNNELPQIPIEYANTKAGGIVHCKVVMDPHNMPNARLIRMGIQDRYHGGKIKEGSHYMQISKVFKKSEQGLDAIMIHEMIHVYFNTQKLFGENHGMKFAKMARALGQKVGFEIPLTDNVERFGLGDESKLKSIGVLMLTKKEGTIYIALMTDKNMISSLSDLVARWTDMVKYNYAFKAEMYTVASVKWTELAHRYPLQRRKPIDLGFYALKDPDAIADLHTNGKLLASVPGTE